MVSIEHMNREQAVKLAEIIRSELPLITVTVVDIDRIIEGSEEKEYLYSIIGLSMDNHCFATFNNKEQYDFLKKACYYIGDCFRPKDISTHTHLQEVESSFLL